MKSQSYMDLVSKCMQTAVTVSPATNKQGKCRVPIPGLGHEFRVPSCLPFIQKSDSVSLNIAIQILANVTYMCKLEDTERTRAGTYSYAMHNGVFNRLHGTVWHNSALFWLSHATENTGYADLVCIDEWGRWYGNYVPWQETEGTFLSSIVCASVWIQTEKRGENKVMKYIFKLILFIDERVQISQWKADINHVCKGKNENSNCKNLDTPKITFDLALLLTCLQCHDLEVVNKIYECFYWMKSHNFPS